MMKPYRHAVNLQEALEHRILHGLRCEWEQACAGLPARDRTRMKPPFFCLRDMKSRLGTWSHAKNELAVSRSLVMNYPWDDVREVLAHEMAHQYAAQVLDATNETPHGPQFKKACGVLGANPKASGQFKPLHDTLRDNGAGSNDRILIRVKKLMSLAQSSNQHEAEAAMAKAHLLIEKYNVDLLQEASRRDFISTFLGAPALRHSRENYHMAHLLQTFYFIQGIWISTYVVEKGKMGRVFEISGTIPNVKMAAYVYHFIIRFIHRQWDKYNQVKGLNRHRKTDFSIGIIEGFYHQLAQKKSERTPPASVDALVPVKDPLLTRYMSDRYPRTKSFRRTASSQNEGVLRDGYSIGEKLVISKGITHTAPSDRRLPYDV